MNIPFPRIEKIKWVYPPTAASMPNNIVDTKISEVDTALFSHKSQLTNLTSFSQTYAQKHSSINLEYERKASTIEKSLIEQNAKLDNYCRNLLTQCQNLYCHIVQLTRRVELLEEKLKLKKSKHVGNSNHLNTLFTLPLNIDT